MKVINLDKLLLIIKGYCQGIPTCENCPYRLEHKGCYFRGKTPREWEI